MQGGVRGSVPKPMQMAHQYLFYRDAEADAKRLKEQAGGQSGAEIKSYIETVGEPNGDHLDWIFDNPVTINGVTYTGMRRQAISNVLMDEELAQELVEAKGLRDRVAKEVTTTVWDWEELFVLNQEGLIEDSELDALMTTEVRYSLVVIK